MDTFKQTEGEALSLEDALKQQETEKLDREKYGRLWVWEGYFSDKLEAKWLETADQLKNVNDHVIQDIEDYILL